MLPNRKILVHKPVEVRNLGKKLQDRDLSTGDWHWQVKYDGCHCIVIVRGGAVEFYTREGNPVLSLNHLVSDLMQWPPGVYFCEAWCSGKEFSEISGLFRRQTSSSETAALKLVVFDSVSYSEFHAGRSDLPFDLRWKETVEAYFSSPHTNIILAAGAIGGSPSLIELQAEVKRRKSEGLWEEDGFIAKERAGIWIAGAGKGGEQIKVKDHISVDIECLAVYEGEGKFRGMVGALLCLYAGQPLKVGGGKLTDAERQTYWDDPSLIEGKIVEVHGLKGSTNGLIREPRFQRIRHDKTEPSE
ncbi:ATP-dependent DNA ligase [Psuedomonas phage SVOphi44]